MKKHQTNFNNRVKEKTSLITTYHGQESVKLKELIFSLLELAILTLEG